MVEQEKVATKWSEKLGYGVTDWLLVFCLFSIYAGSVTPEVNESHYWVKASHFWNPGFVSRDLFAGSKDAHWFFFATVGSLTRFFSLPTATWIGRILGWAVLSFAWCFFVRKFSSLKLPGVLTAGCWIAATHWGHLSGEWVVGGCEAKVFAYASAFLGLGFFIERSYGWGWIWLGVASAFHVVTGGWAVLCAMLVLWASNGWNFLSQQSSAKRADEMHSNSSGLINLLSPSKTIGRIGIHWDLWGGLFVGGALSLPGLLPALALQSGVSLVDQDRGAIIYAFQRLPHHLVPTRFATERWWSFVVLLVTTTAVIVMVRKLASRNSSTNQNASLAAESDVQFAERLMTRYRVLVQLAVGFVGIALAGLLVDVSLSSWATNWSASLLRYYWFRWNDVIWPTVLVISLLLLLEKSINGLRVFRYLSIVALILPGVFVLGSQYISHYRDSISPADHATLLLRNETPQAQRQVHRDWLDMCSFIRANTPENALFLTPRFQQTFKWNACRAEFVCWKDSPQDALSLIEWETRLMKLFPRNKDGYGIPLSDRILFELSSDYNIDYVLIDRRIQKTPPVQEFIHSNATFALFRVIKFDAD